MAKQNLDFDLSPDGSSFASREVVEDAPKDKTDAKGTKDEGATGNDAATATGTGKK